jgi:hypothetical protein
MHNVKKPNPHENTHRKPPFRARIGPTRAVKEQARSDVKNVFENHPPFAAFLSDARTKQLMTTINTDQRWLSVASVLLAATLSSHLKTTSGTLNFVTVAMLLFGIDLAAIDESGDLAVG